MANEAQQLGVYFEGQPVGMVAVDDAGRFTFEYAQAWKSNRNAFAISRSLPLEGGDAQSNAGQAFFANLLPEGRVRELVARRLGVSQGNDFALLDALGGECAGALVISRAPPTPKAHSYRPLDEHEIAALAGRGRAFAETSGTDGIRLSLAGAQDKLAVKVDGSRLLLPEGESPSTHILKFANPDYKHLPENELFVTRLAGQCDIPTVSAELHAIGKTRHLLVRRYDRVIDTDGSIRRLHQEDLCQALGVGPARKYEEEGGPRFDQCFGVVDEMSIEPALDTRALLPIRFASMNASKSAGAIRMAFRIRMCGSAPSAHRPYTVAVQRQSCPAASRTERRPARPGCRTSSRAVAPDPGSNRVTNGVRTGATVRDSWERDAPSVVIFSLVCNPLPSTATPWSVPGPCFPS